MAQPCISDHRDKATGAGPHQKRGCWGLPTPVGMIGGVTANSGKHLWWPPQGIRRGGALPKPCGRLSYAGPHPCLTPPLRPSNSDMPAEIRSGGALRGWSGDAGLAPSPPTCSPCFICVSLGFHLCPVWLPAPRLYGRAPAEAGWSREAFAPPLIQSHAPGGVGYGRPLASRPHEYTWTILRVHHRRLSGSGRLSCSVESSRERWRELDPRLTALRM